MISDREKKKFLLWVVSPVALVALVWSFSTDGNVLRAVQFAITFGGLPLAWLALRQLKNEKAKSGLSEEEFLLKQAGGATELLSQSITIRAIGWLCVIGPIVLVLVVAMGTKSLPITVMAAVLTEIFCIPCAIGCFRSAAKSRRAAERAGAKIW